MAIVKMKKLRLLAVNEGKDSFLNKLLKLGCVQITETELEPDSHAAEVLLPSGDSNYDLFSEKLAVLEAAYKVLGTFAPHKSNIFSELNPVKIDKFFDCDYYEETFKKARELIELGGEHDGLQEKISACRFKLSSLEPWKNMDIPLDKRGTDCTDIIFFRVPDTVDFSSVQAEIEENAPHFVLETVNTDSDGTLYWSAVYKDEAPAFRDTLRACGIVETDFSEYHGTAAEAISELRRELSDNQKAQDEIKNKIVSYKDVRTDIETCIDETAQELQREEVKRKLTQTDAVFALEGWAPVPQLDKLTEFLNGQCCAYEFSDPEPGDETVPVKLKNPWFIEPINMVTEMYSLPAYDNIDPNPLIFPWFTMFFGIMYADMGYGLVLFTLGIIGSKLVKKKGTIKYMTGLLILCGITTFFWGFLFGGFFGDAVPVLCDMLGMEHHELWSLIDPLEQPMTALFGSIAIGVVHLLLGMAINAVLLIRDGKPLDALFDVGSWWVLFAGIALGVLGRGWIVALVGVAMLILTQGRDKPTLIGKLIGGVSSLYDVTSYLGDVLSYTRLMALMLAGSVIASVVNTLGSLPGSMVAFVIIFIIGHLFNMGINIIGTFVHAARLQYLEFFGKFYKEGGKPYRPFAYKTKYTDIVK